MEVKKGALFLMRPVPRRALLALLPVVPLLAFSAKSQADTPTDASDFVRRLVASALAILQRQTSDEQRERSFKKLLMQNFDIPQISRFVLGRYWARTSAEDRQKFIDTYGEFVIRSYASDFSNYAGETVRVTSARLEDDKFAIVMSEIVHSNGEPPFQISWRIYKGTDGFKVLDLDIEGISMLLAQREEFASAIQHNGGTAAGLTLAIQQKINGSSTARLGN
jgi:phospholipid transport system substrate-binding protein